MWSTVLQLLCGGRAWNLAARLLLLHLIEVIRCGRCEPGHGRQGPCTTLILLLNRGDIVATVLDVRLLLRVVTSAWVKVCPIELHWFVGEQAHDTRRKARTFAVCIHGCLLVTRRLHQELVLDLE